MEAVENQHLAEQVPDYKADLADMVNLLERERASHAETEKCLREDTAELAAMRTKYERCKEDNTRVLVGLTPNLVA